MRNPTRLRRADGHIGGRTVRGAPPTVQATGRCAVAAQLHSEPEP